MNNLHLETVRPAYLPETQNLIEIKAWDSKFFGFKIADHIQNHFNAQELGTAIEHAKAQDVSLLVFKAPPETRHIPFNVTARLVDQRNRYGFDLETVEFDQGDRIANAIEIYEGTESNKILEALSVKAGAYSRFFSDPAFPKPAAIALYKAWMRASLKKEMADVVFITRDETGQIAGIGAGRIEPDGTGVPTLMAVDDHMIGKGLGRSFVLMCMKWLKQQGVKQARITTQSRNKLACNCYQRLGWQLEIRQDIFHIWLKPPTTKTRYL